MGRSPAARVSPVTAHKLVLTPLGHQRFDNVCKRVAVSQLRSLIPDLSAGGQHRGLLLRGEVRAFQK